MRYCCGCLWLVINRAFGQTVLTGRVTDTHQAAIPNTNVTLHLPRSSAILAFAITDKNGFYIISSKSAADTLMLKAYGLGYATQQRTILNKTQEINFALAEQSIKLKEVVVKEQPITRSGDTLSYAVGAFKNQSDRAIGDVIRRMPGIEVQPDGKILYQGKAINKYYIEGLDLLGGQYSLANENLPADAVSRVEVLENHQPVRMLDSLVFSENAALNIRLKNKVTTTGTARVGIGAAPVLWEADVSPMLFTRGQQMIASYQANNIGQNVGRQIKILTIEDVLNPFEKDQPPKTWVQIMPLATPTFSDTRWFDNKIHLGTINFLKKLTNGYELKLNLSYLNDRQQQTGNTQTISYTSNDTISISESKRNNFIFNTLDVSLMLEKNDQSKYFKNQFLFKRRWDSEAGLLLLNNRPLTQTVANPFYALSNHLKNIFKIKKQVLTFQSFVSLQNSPQSLTIALGIFEEILNNQLIYNELRQTTTFQGFFTHNMVSLTKTLKNGFSVSPQVGFQVEKQRLQSQMTRASSEAVGSEFENQLDWQKINAYVKFQTQYRRQKWRITLNTPLNYYDFWVQDKPLQQQQTLQQITFKPRLSTSYEATTFWTLKSNLDRRNTFGDIDNLFCGYLLRNYRTIERRNAPLPTNVALNGSLSINYRNPIESVFGYITYSKTLTNNNLLYGTQLAANGAAESYALALPNESMTDMLMGQTSKYFLNLKIQVTLDGQLTLSKRPQIINGFMTTIRNQSRTFGLRLNGKVSKWADWEYRYKNLNFENRIDNRASQPIIQQQHQLNLGLYPAQNLYIGFKNEYYVNRFITQSNRTIFSDLVLRYTWAKRKIDFETVWNNIWNASQLSLISVNTFSYVESNYQLRPTQVIQRVRFSF